MKKIEICGRDSKALFREACCILTIKHREGAQAWDTRVPLPTYYSVSFFKPGQRENAERGDMLTSLLLTIRYNPVPPFPPYCMVSAKMVKCLRIKNGLIRFFILLSFRRGGPYNSYAALYFSHTAFQLLSSCIDFSFQVLKNVEPGGAAVQREILPALLYPAYQGKHLRYVASYKSFCVLLYESGGPVFSSPVLPALLVMIVNSYKKVERGKLKLNWLIPALSYYFCTAVLKSTGLAQVEMLNKHIVSSLRSYFVFKPNLTRKRGDRPASGGSPRVYFLKQREKIAQRLIGAGIHQCRIKKNYGSKIIYIKQWRDGKISHPSIVKNRSREGISQALWYALPAHYFEKEFFYTIIYKSQKPIKYICKNVHRVERRNVFGTFIFPAQLLFIKATQMPGGSK